jgi:hypothetical protein
MFFMSFTAEIVHHEELEGLKKILLLYNK